MPKSLLCPLKLGSAECVQSACGAISAATAACACLCRDDTHTLRVESSRGNLQLDLLRRRPISSSVANIEVPHSQIPHVRRTARQAADQPRHFSTSVTRDRALQQREIEPFRRHASLCPVILLS
ncbi:hypothetical protein CONLIGDRAFT_517267 [Coniochaeta ligniaria NRRL 30616]|uniref:Uncharacterized protein n=1 Tax=Coniochaeta ligniaria NRRL 30616 TaxID=1408157 RepID=A0A1J7IEE1_9PEZI|nr:hypothetical protein CONLIGDRAFT_517267 [Coniochaeta ligniaria NRRL 30616]